MLWSIDIDRKEAPWARILTYVPWKSTFTRLSAVIAVTVLVLLGIAATATAATTSVCALDDPPGATLLLPYFEVDLDHADGPTTLFSVNNASATAVPVPFDFGWLFLDLKIPRPGKGTAGSAKAGLAQ